MIFFPIKYGSIKSFSLNGSKQWGHFFTFNDFKQKEPTILPILNNSD